MYGRKVGTKEWVCVCIYVYVCVCVHMYIKIRSSWAAVKHPHSKSFGGLSGKSHHCWNIIRERCGFWTLVSSVKHSFHLSAAVCSGRMGWATLRWLHLSFFSHLNSFYLVLKNIVEVILTSCPSVKIGHGCFYPLENP